MRGGCVLTSIPMPARRNPGPGSVVAETAVGHIRAPFSGGGLRSRPVARCAGAGKVWHGSGMGLAWVCRGCQGGQGLPEPAGVWQGRTTGAEGGKREGQRGGAGKFFKNYSWVRKNKKTKAPVRKIDRSILYAGGVSAYSYRGAVGPYPRKNACPVTRFQKKKNWGVRG